MSSAYDSTITRRAGSSPWSARLDVAQSVSGLLLALFMWAHMLFVSSILLGERAMWTVTRFFEGYFVFGRSYPALVAAVVAGAFALFLVHAVLALRKVPHDYRQWRAFNSHRALLKHGDTSLWWLQVLTGVVVAILGVAHLNQMLLYPADIGPYQSADRVWSERWWPAYLVLLFAVELHGGVGLYRLAVKWGVFDGGDARITRARLRVAKWCVTGFFLALGLATLAAYMQIGYAHRHHVGEIYHPDVHGEAVAP